ncbi:MAG TPA: hypothetical protein VEN79_00775, partial [Terriglobia bacterium]|nr:hypothetical protein [Terriglobia bacterium]
MSKRDAWLSRHREMSRWALGVVATLALIIGVSFLRAFPSAADQDKDQDTSKQETPKKVSKEEKR